MTPPVSVLLPAYNAAKYVGEAIESILSQTYADFELIVVDDGSIDTTIQVVREFDDSRLRVLCNERNRGLVFSLNRAASVARGEFFARMDADDWSFPDRLSVQVDWMQHNPRLGVLGCFYETFDDQHERLGSVKLPITDAQVRYDLYSKHHCFCHPAVLMRRQALEQAGGYQSNWFPAEDRALWLRMLETWHGANVPRYLHRMRRHATSISSQNSKRQAELVVKTTSEALGRGQWPDDVDPAIQRAGWARGALFSAFGLSIESQTDTIRSYQEQAIALDELTTRSSFEELLRDRIVAYLHHTEADVAGCRTLLQRVFASLPTPLAHMQAVRSRMEAQIHAIAAFHHANEGAMAQSRREAIKALLTDRTQWQNRGLVKLAVGIGK